MLFRYEDIKNMLLDKKACAEWLQELAIRLNNLNTVKKSGGFLCNMC